MIFEIILMTLIIFLLFWKKGSEKLPPGPRKLPFIGNIPFLTLKNGTLDWTLDKSVTKNDITRIQLGPIQLFVVNNFDLAKELFGKEEFSGRKVSEFQLAHRFFSRKAQGIINTQGKHWETQRRFALKTLKDFGFGKQSLESAINIEINEIIEQFLSSKGDVLLSYDFNVPIINILWQLVAGSRFTKDDPEGMKLVENVNEQFRIGIKIHLIPNFVHKLFPNFTGYGRRVAIAEEQKEQMMKEIKEHQKTLDEENPRDFIDIYLREIGKESKTENFNIEDLGAVMMDFFHAGTETSSTTLKWIIEYLTLYQDVQSRCRQEIVSVLANSQCESKHLPSLPYVQATITEIQRVARVAPMSLLHSTSRKSNVGEYLLPKGSMVVANLSFITNDPEIFTQPEVFNPDRWIGSDGRFLKNERMIPFGIGKRYCMGEILARNEIFLFTVNLLQRIRFLPPISKPLPDISKYNASLTRIPDDFYVRFEPC